MPKRFCIIQHRDYPGDLRTRNQLQSALEAGFEASVICIKKPGQSYYSDVEGVHVYRLPAMQREHDSKLGHVAEYLSFCFTTFIFMTGFHIYRRQHVIQSANLPDFLVFSAIVPKLVGAKIINDFRECTPELYAADGVPMDGLMMKMLILMEQLSIRFSNLALSCTETMRRRLVERGTPPEKVKVMLNVPSDELSKDPRWSDPEASVQSQFRLITHGTIKPRYDYKVLIRAIGAVKDRIPGIHLEIAGDGEQRPELETLVKELALQDYVSFTGFLPEDVLFEHLRAADCGVVPLIRTPDIDVIHTNRMFRHIALGRPVIISRTTAVEEYFDEDSLLYVAPHDSEALAEAIWQLYNSPNQQYTLAKNAFNTYQKFPLKQQITYYAGVLQGLVA